MFQAGFARVDVTPPLGSPLAGYFHERTSDGVLDPIELNAVAVNDGKNTVVIITSDFLYVMENAATEIRGKISAATGVPEEHLFLQGLHQHTSLRIGCKPHLSTTRFSDQEYLDVLYRKYVDVTKMAIADMCEAEVGVAQQETDEVISFVRRFRMKDGSTRTNPGRFNPDVVGPIGEADNTVRLVRIKREGTKDIAIVNFSTHPDVIGGNKFSADWPGFVRRMTEADIPNVNCILINGAQGDTNHVNVNSNGTIKGYEHSRHMGRVITDTVLKIWDKTEKREATPVSGQVQMKYIPTNTKYMDRVEEFKKKMQDLNAGLIPKPEMGELAEMSRVSQLYEETLFQKVPVSVVGMGQIGFVGFGGEPFTQYATAAREAAPEMFVITACLTNGGQGYLPTKEAFDEGGYEARNSRFTAPVAEILQGTAKEMLDAHQKA